MTQEKELTTLGGVLDALEARVGMLEGQVTPEQVAAVIRSINSASQGSHAAVSNVLSLPIPKEQAAVLFEQIHRLGTEQAVAGESETDPQDLAAANMIISLQTQARKPLTEILEEEVVTGNSLYREWRKKLRELAREGRHGPFPHEKVKQIIHDIEESVLNALWQTDDAVVLERMQDKNDVWNLELVPRDVAEIRALIATLDTDLAAASVSEEDTPELLREIEALWWEKLSRATEKEGDTGPDAKKERENDS